VLRLITNSNLVDCTTGRSTGLAPIYLKYAGHQQIQGEKSWDAIALEDFAQLRKAGLGHPLMDEVEKLFTEQRTGQRVVAA
jgi:hypothetical protein